MKTLIFVDFNPFHQYRVETPCFNLGNRKYNEMSKKTVEIYKNNIFIILCRPIICH